MPPPKVITVEKPSPSGAAKSSIAALTAPDCATIARRPGSAAGAQNVALSPMSVRMTPSAPGPTRRTPRLRAIADTVRDHAPAPARSTRVGALISTAAPKPPFGTRSRILGTTAAGVAITARSIA